MSVCGQTEEDGASEEAGVPIRDIYEQKAVSKVVRVLTVLAYLLSVSLAAILLSVYYICVWKSPELPPLNETEEGLSAHRGGHHDYYIGDEEPLQDLTGRGNTTVSETATPTINFTKSFDTDHELSSLTRDVSNLTSGPSEFAATETFLSTEDSILSPDTTLPEMYNYNRTSDGNSTYNFTRVT